MSSFYNHFRKNILKKSPAGSPLVHYDNVKPEQKIGLSNVPPEWQEIRASHYQKWLGESDLVIHEVIPVVPHVDIFVFEPDPERGRNYFTCVTSGMSDEVMHTPKEAGRNLSRAELIFYTADFETELYAIEQSWYINAMRLLAHFPFDYKTWLGVGHTLPNGNPAGPVVEGSELTTALFLQPVFEKIGFQNGLKLGNDVVNFLWLTYITDDECEYKLNRGLSALAQHFNAKSFPQVFDPFRKSVLKQ